MLKPENDELLGKLSMFFNQRKTKGGVVKCYTFFFCTYSYLYHLPTPMNVVDKEIKKENNSK